MSKDAQSASHIVFTRPISDLKSKINTALAEAQGTDRAVHIAVVGTGAAGVELAFAVQEQARCE